MKNTPKWDALCLECQAKNNGTCSPNTVRK